MATMNMTTIEVPKDRAWCGRGFYVTLGDDTETVELVQADETTRWEGQWFRREDFDALLDGATGMPYTTDSPEAWRTFLTGKRATMVLPPNKDGRRQFMVDGRVVREWGY